MSKRIVRKKKEARRARREWPLVVYIWIVGLGVSGYVFVGRLLLETRPHPVHWLAGLLGALAGVPLGWLWYRWRGDVLF